MEAGPVFGCLSVMLAFAAACSLSVALTAEVASDRKRAAAAQLDSSLFRSGIAARRLRNGFGFCIPLSRKLLKARFLKSRAEKCVWLLAEHGWATTSEALLSVAMAAIVLTALLVGIASGSLLVAVAVAASLAGLVVVGMKTAWEKRTAAMREAVPDALRGMGVCFRSGLSLLQTLNQVASETKGPLKEPFQRSARLLETGSSTSVALDSFRAGSSVPELSFVAVALDVQHQTGGSMAQVLNAARETVESELALERSLRVQTAQAKLSARIVTVMPFLLIALFSLASNDFLAPFFTSIAGMAMLALALSMQVAGVLLVRHMLKVEVA